MLFFLFLPLVAAAYNGCDLESTELEAVGLLQRRAAPLRLARNDSLLQKSALLKVGAAGAEAATVAAPDSQDWGVIVLVFIVSVVMYAIVFAVQLSSPKNEEPEDEEQQLAWLKKVPFKWAVPKPGVRAEALPALCSRFLTNHKDMPLLLPPESLKGMAPGWAADVLGGPQKKRLLKAVMLLGSSGKRTIKVFGHGPHEEPDQLLGSVNVALELQNGLGKAFGHLVKEGEDYVLHESSGREARWAVSVKPGEAGVVDTVVSWKPKSKLLATAHKDRQGLSVEAGTGVDALLVLLCALGLHAFELQRRLPGRFMEVKDRVEAEARHMKEELLQGAQALEARLEGGAASLLHSAS